MIDEVIFLSNVLPYELFPVHKNDITDAEIYFHNYFITKTYRLIVEEENTAVYSALLFWYTIRGHALKCCTSRIMVSPEILSHYAKSINNDLINELEEDNHYASLYYDKHFDH